MIWPLIKSLKPQVLVAALVGWNVLAGIGMALNGGMGELRTVGGALGMVVASAALAAFGFGTALLPAWQGALMRPGVDPAPARPALLLMGLIGTLLAGGGLYTVAGLVHGG